MASFNNPIPQLDITSLDDIRRPIRVPVSSGDAQDLIRLVRSDLMGGVSIDISKIEVVGSVVPDKIVWQVYAARFCSIEDEPIAEGVTFLKGAQGLDRQGLLFELRRLATTYLIRGYCVAPGGADCKVWFLPSLIVLPQDSPGPRVVAGTCIG